MELVSVDVGGTHARFAIAEIQGRQVRRLEPEVTLKTAEHASLQTAWEEFGARVGSPLPRAAAIAVAGPARGKLLKLTNNPWVINTVTAPAQLGVDHSVVINDFGAVAHAVAHLPDAFFDHLCGPDVSLPTRGIISVVGPGTGLGVGQIVRRHQADMVIETEGGHIGFAPCDNIDDRILAYLRKQYGRVSAERIASGPGLFNIYRALAKIEGDTLVYRRERELWEAALEGDNRLVVAALDRFCFSLGAVAGDIALAQGASAVVIGGGLGLRLAAVLKGSGFRSGFVAKGRFEGKMEEMPVRLINHPQPGLFGAAAAFAAEYGHLGR